MTAALPSGGPRDLTIAAQPPFPDRTERAAKVIPMNRNFSRPKRLAGDRHAARAFFVARLAEMWGRHLRENYANPAQVQRAFGCSMSTAYRWWSGDAAPDAPVLLAEFAEMGGGDGG